MLDGQGLHQSESPMIAFIWNKPPFDLYEYKGMPIGRVGMRPVVREQGCDARGHWFETAPQELL